MAENNNYLMPEFDRTTRVSELQSKFQREVTSAFHNFLKSKFDWEVEFGFKRAQYRELISSSVQHHELGVQILESGREFQRYVKPASSISKESQREFQRFKKSAFRILDSPQRRFINSTLLISEEPQLEFERYVIPPLRKELKSRPEFQHCVKSAHPISEEPQPKFPRYSVNVLKPGDVWCMIAKKWLDRLENYFYKDGKETFDVRDTATNPGPIDNSSLFKDVESGEIKDNLIKGVDYILVPEEVFELLVSRQGLTEGQQPIKRNVVKNRYTNTCKVEIDLMEFKLCLNSDRPGEFIKKKFSRLETIAFIEKEMRKTFNIVDQKETRLWVRYGIDAYNRIISNKRTTIQNAGLFFDGQIIIIEEKNYDGTWPREVKGVARKSCSMKRKHEGYLNYHIKRAGEVVSEPQGVCGLNNLGCQSFMNSALQCLSNTPLLLAYFVNKSYLDELNVDTGTHGNIAKTFGELIIKMWSGQCKEAVHRNFKAIMGKFEPRFSKCKQQDCQEYLVFLLDALHRDLNRVKEEIDDKLQDTDEQADEMEVTVPEKGKDLCETVSESHTLAAKMKIFVSVYEIIHELCDTVNEITQILATNMDVTVPVGEIIYELCDAVSEITQIPVTNMDVTVPVGEIIDELCDAVSGITQIPLTNMEVTVQEIIHELCDAVSEITQIPVTIMDITVPEVEQIQDISDAVSEMDITVPEVEQIQDISDAVSEITEIPAADVVAKEAWETYQKRNNSIIVDIFHGLLQSSLICLDCSKVSIKFDPFCYLPLPLPSEEKIKFIIILVKSDPQKKPITMKVIIPQVGKIQDLCDAVSEMTQISATNLIVANVYNHRIFKIFGNDEDLMHITNLKKSRIFMYEIYSQAEDDAFMLPVYFRTREHKRGISGPVSVCSLFGLPIFVPVNSTGFTFQMLYDVLLQYMSRFLKCPTSKKEEKELETNELEKQNVEIKITTGKDYNSEIQVQRKSEKEINTKETKNKDKFTFTIYSVNAFANIDIAQIRDNGIPLMLDRKMYLALEFDKKVKQEYFEENTFANFPEHKSLNEQFIDKQRTVLISECLEQFTTNEVLDANNLWYCPACKKHKQATKKLDFWSLPQVLIIHLKRFSTKYRQITVNKNNIMVKFPTSGLDMTKYISNPSHDPALYDLIAVVNHYGGVGGGHYFTHCKNILNNNWYFFDDHIVKRSSKENVVSNAAYILFYSRTDSFSSLHINQQNYPATLK